MINFPGYVTIGSIDLSDHGMDLEAYAIVYADTVTGDVFTLYASGCVCCSDALDDLLPGYGERAASLRNLGTTLVDHMNDTNLDGDARMLAEEQMRDIIRSASDRFAPATLDAREIAAIGS
ncbi:hypothetical protein [Embleya sp. AB8]|uniref:hypothetical protein n=1 Tax=Embleya sp. AB8 TaxID=3156304 RepID=UPI003C7190C9